MKIVFFSDAHGNIYAVESFLLDIANKNIDLVIFGGDVFGYYYNQDEIINKFRSCNIKMLLGNHDKMFLDLLYSKIEEDTLIKKYGNSYKDIKNKISKDNIDFLKRLESKYVLKINNMKIAFVHGSIDNPLEGRIYPDTAIENEDFYIEYDYVFCGHTHHKMIRKLYNTVIVNPGSIGQQRDGKGCSYVTFDTITRELDINIISYDVNSLIEQIELNEDDFIIKEKLKEVLKRN